MVSGTLYRRRNEGRLCSLDKKRNRTIFLALIDCPRVTSLTANNSGLYRCRACWSIQGGIIEKWIPHEMPYSVTFRHDTRSNSYIVGTGASMYAESLNILQCKNVFISQMVPKVIDKEKLWLIWEIIFSKPHVVDQGLISAVNDV